MTTLDQVKAWNNLNTELNKIPDRNLRIAMREDLRRRALKDWGWVPGETIATTAEPELDDWEKEFLMDIKDTIEFGVDARKDKEDETVAARAAMLFFVRTGGELNQIPQDIRSPYIEQLYYEMLRGIGRESLEQADIVIGNSQ